MLNGHTKSILNTSSGQSGFKDLSKRFGGMLPTDQLETLYNMHQGPSQFGERVRQKINISKDEASVSSETASTRNLLSELFTKNIGGRE